MRKFLNLFKSHYSFIPIIFGAGALFLSNILAKEFFSPQDYGYYSILITYFSIVFLFGIFGGEQLFIRISERPEPHLIETSRKVPLAQISEAWGCMGHHGRQNARPNIVDLNSLQFQKVSHPNSPLVRCPMDACACTPGGNFIGSLENGKANIRISSINREQHVFLLACVYKASPILNAFIQKAQEKGT